MDIQRELVKKVAILILPDGGDLPGERRKWSLRYGANFGGDILLLGAFFLSLRSSEEGTAAGSYFFLSLHSPTGPTCGERSLCLSALPALLRARGALADWV